MYSVPTMPMSPASQSSAAPASSRRIPDVIFQSLKSALTVQARRRHDADVTVARLDRTSTDPPMQLRLECSDHVQMAVEIRLRPVGDKVYDVHCTVTEGASHRFTYSACSETGTALSRAPCLGRKLGTFLLDELERHVGRHHLRTQ